MAASAQTNLPRTSVPGPRQRTFLPQSRWDRVRSSIWTAVRVTIFRWSPPFCHWWRRSLLRFFGCRLAKGTTVAGSVRIHFPWNLTIERDARIEPFAILDCMGEVRVGPGARIGRHAHLCAGTHDYHRPDMLIVRKPITVGSGVDIGEDAFIGPGITIGANAVIQPRSSVFESIPPGTTCSGEPAKPTREAELV